MIHVTQLAIPAKTTEANPVSDMMHLTQGRLKQVSVQFPPGCCNLVGVWLEFHSQKVLPWNKAGVLTGDSSTLVFEYDFTLDSDPFDLIFKGYSEDDIFPHTIYFTINLEADKIERTASFVPGIS